MKTPDISKKKHWISVDIPNIAKNTPKLENCEVSKTKRNVFENQRILNLVWTLNNGLFVLHVKKKFLLQFWIKFTTKILVIDFFRTRTSTDLCLSHFLGKSMEIFVLQPGLIKMHKGDWFRCFIYFKFFYVVPLISV